MTAALRFGDHTLPPDRLLPRVRKAAGGLLALGVRDEDVVALVLRNEPAAIEITLACNLIGAYHCPINFHFREQELGYILADSGATALFIHADLLPALAVCGTRCLPRDSGRTLGIDACRAPGAAATGGR